MLLAFVTLLSIRGALATDGPLGEVTGVSKPSQDAIYARYDKLLHERPDLEKVLRTHFTELDRDGNHELDLDELKAELSAREYQMTKHFDVDHSNTIDIQEYLRGPLILHHLEARPTIADQFWKLADLAEFSDDSNKMLDMRDALHHAASGSSTSPSLVEVAEGVSMDPSVAKKVQKMSDDELARFLQLSKDDAKDLTGLSRADQLRFLQTKGFLGGLLGGKKKDAAADKGPAPYATKYGVPSAMDEGCVLCQYVSQLMQRSLYTKLIDSPTGDIGDATPLQIKKTNGMIGQRKNGRGLCRLVVEDTLTEFCDPDSLPELFYPYCKDFWPMQWMFAKCLYYQIPIETWCIETQDCPIASYMGLPTAVHLPSTSLRYNAGRGKCGMSGGVHPPAKKQGLGGALMCAANKALLG